MYHELPFWNQLADAKQEDEDEFGRILQAFHKWMLSDPTRNEKAARSYVRQIAILFEDDGKSAEASGH